MAVGDGGLPFPPPGPQFTPNQPNPSARRWPPKAVIIAASVAAALLLLCCGAAAVNAVIGDNKKNAAPGVSAAAATTTAATAPTSKVPSPAASLSASASPSAIAVTMPNLVGKNAAVAQDELKRLGLTKVQLGSQDPGDSMVILAANWTVTKQSQPAESQVTTDTLIVLTCTKKA
ncbi:PASTA domain-containing protein [Dactylosporangium sp. NPDC051484]|uniref:PASTA domain-containing protein n=1 Tax=Dactylosporangium sp. NPDC051484 TaxID=3154942 RepID=UPI00344C9D3F